MISRLASCSAPAASSVSPTERNSGATTCAVRTDAMTAQIGKHLRLRGLAIAGVPVNAYDPH